MFGAGKGIELQTARQALDAGFAVRAFARSAKWTGLSNASLPRLSGDALKAEDVAVALEGVGVVTQTLDIKLSQLLGPILLFSEATRTPISAMKGSGDKRRRI